MKLIALSIILGLTASAWNLNGFTDAVWPVIIGSSITMTGFIVPDAYGDVKNGVTSHTKEVLKRWWIFLVSCYGLITGQYFLFLAYNCMYYWIVFDPVYNHYSGLKWNYLGTTALLDRIFRAWWQQYIVKFFLTGLVLWYLL